MLDENQSQKMQDEKIADLILLAEHETQDFQDFQLDFDPKKQWSVFKFENVLAKVVKIGWNVKLYVNSKPMSVNESLSPSVEGWDEVATLNLAPSYI